MDKAALLRLFHLHIEKVKLIEAGQIGSQAELENIDRQIDSLLEINHYGSEHLPLLLQQAKRFIESTAFHTSGGH